LVLGRELSGVGMRDLRRSYLKRRIDEHPIRVAIPLRLEACLDVLELHLLDHDGIKDAGVPRVVVKDRAVTILLRGPEIIPLRPYAVGAEVHREEAVEMRKSFLGKKIERQRDPGRPADSPRTLSQ